MWKRNNGSGAMKTKPETHISNIIKALCDCSHEWSDVKKGKCTRCNRSIKPATTCVFLTKTGKYIGHLYSCYRPPRPLNISPVAYYKKYKCVDDNYTRKTNGKYYCNPAHCSRSWKNKQTRDEHLKMAYAIL